ncbi:serine hydrolase domain-containing protein [Flavobacteriaceae bacterium M23B6Z8]
MRNLTIVIFLNIIFAFTACAQRNQQNYQGEWVGFLPNKKSFNFQISLKPLENNQYHLTIANDEILIDQNVKSSSKERILFDIQNQLFFNLMYDKPKNALTGFIRSGKLMYHVTLKQGKAKKFTGPWDAFMVDKGLKSDDIMLYLENNEDGSLGAYPFFGDQRFRGAWTGNFKRNGDTLRFRDGMTGFNFRALLLDDKIELSILLTDVLLTKTSLTHTKDGWEYHADPFDRSQNTNKPVLLNDGWPTAASKDAGIKENQLIQLIEDANTGKLVNVHSVLIARKDTLVFENYFNGFNANIPHDLRSASKSISSALIGIAIEDGHIKSVEESLYDFIPEEYQYTKNELKSKITIKDLLTMSSGFDVNNLASENYYQDPNRDKSWLQTVLEAPVVKEPGTYADYGSANPFLLGICLDQRLETPLELYMHEKLFAPLGITHYINQTDDKEITPYFGGGMLLTPRDLLKFGQLYLNNGKWSGKQIIPKQWVAASFKKHVQLQDVKDKNEYGYLWWHDTYQINRKTVKSIEARGAGGQFIFILPELESVVVITSGNFRNRKGNQPREILKKYILPAMMD